MIFAFLGGFGTGIVIGAGVMLWAVCRIGQHALESRNNTSKQEQPTKPVFDEYQDNN